MYDKEPQSTDRQLIKSTVEEARSDMSNQTTLPAGWLDRYIDIVMEEARAEDQETIEQLRRDKQFLEDRVKALNCDLRLTNEEIRTLRREKSIIEDHYQEFKNEVLDVVRGALGAIATTEIIKPTVDSEPATESET